MGADIFAVIGRKIVVDVVDVGAMSLADDHDVYYQLTRANAARVTGFEPIADECAKRNAAAPEGHRFLPYALGDGRDRTLHVCKVPMNTSLYEPNRELLDRFQNLGHMFDVVDRIPIATRRMDDLPEMGDVDFLKIDVQGAELDVMQGARRCLEKAVIVNTEAEFAPLYKDQPLFAEVDQFLRKAGFTFHKFGFVAGRAFKPLQFKHDINQTIGQLLWSDAVYVKDFMAFDQLAPEKLLKLAVVLHVVYQSYDLAAQALMAYDRSSGTELAERYLAALMADEGTAPTG